MLLVCLGLALAGCTTRTLPVVDAETHATQRETPLKVGVYVGRGPGGVGAVEWLRLVEESPDMELKLVDGVQVRQGALDGLDVLVMPGGASKTEFESLGTNGVARMKAFIRKGGGYIGTCAGCCLLMDGPKQRANVIPWNSTGSESDLLFPRFKLTDAGRKAMGLTNQTVVMRYHGGPFMWPTTNRIEGAKFELWGTYDAEATFRGALKKQKKMYGAAAIVGGTYGKGRVFVTAAHPEYFDSTLDIVQAAFRYVTGRTVAFPSRVRTPRAVSVGYLTTFAMSLQTARDVLTLAKERDFDLVPVNGDGIFTRALDHVDVLVVPDSSKKLSDVSLRLIRAFAARGGKVVAYGGGVKLLPEGRGSVACGSMEEAVKAIHGLFPRQK